MSWTAPIRCHLRSYSFERHYTWSARVEFAQQTFIIQDEAELLFFAVLLIEAVHAGHRLQQIMFLEWLADIENGVARGVETCQQLRYHDQNFRVLLAPRRRRSFDGYIQSSLLFRLMICSQNLRTKSFNSLSTSSFPSLSSGGEMMISLVTWPIFI